MVRPCMAARCSMRPFMFRPTEEVTRVDPTRVPEVRRAHDTGRPGSAEPRCTIVLVSLLALACGGPPADTPSAVILFSPDTICEGDAHHATVMLDGTMSSRHLSLVPLPPEDT